MNILRCLAFLGATAAPLGAVSISLVFPDHGLGGVNGSGISATQAALMRSTADYWEAALPAYQEGISLGPVSISAHATSFDGSGNVFAEAGPTALDFQQGFFLASAGSIAFDGADLTALEAGGGLQTVMLHEIAHVLGFGTLWSINGLYVEGSAAYTGSAAVSAFAAEFSPGASFVPVELGGGLFTAGLHWDEPDGGLTGSGLLDAAGRDFGSELMTGWTGPGAAFVSATTLRSFEDLGFTTVPEPSQALLVAMALGAGLARRRERKDLVGNR